MKKSLIKNSILPIFGTFLTAGLLSCAATNTPQPAVEDHDTPQNSPSKESAPSSNLYVNAKNNTSTSVKSTIKVADTIKVFDRASFRFELPANSELTSDPYNELAPIEFFNSEAGLRGELRVMDEPDDNLMDLARVEMQSKWKSGAKNNYTELKPTERLGMPGIFWEIAGSRESETYQAAGFVTAIGGKLYYANLSSETIRDREEFAKLWTEAFNMFQPNGERTADAGPEISVENVQEYHSAALGYSFKTSDTLWHYWNGVSKQNVDPDLVLVNTKEEVSLFVYGAMVPEDEVNEQNLFKVLCRRLGLNAKETEFETRKKKEGNRSVTSFTATRRIGDFDFKYVGKYFYESGRGILVAGWTQGILEKQYAKVLERAVEGVTLEDMPQNVTDKKTNKFNAAVLTEAGMMYLEDDQPLVSLAYFERANKMDPEEPVHLINCGFVYQLKELYGPGISHFESQIDLVKTNAKLLAILGEMYESVYDYGNARKYVEMALRYTPNEPEYVINLSDALWGIGQRTQSLEVVRNLYDKQPSSRLGVYVAKTYMGLDQYAEAVELMYGTRDKFGTSKDLGITMMDALIFLGRYGEALSISEETMKVAPRDNKVKALRGKILFHLKNYKQAEKILAEVVAKEPENEDAKSFLSATRAFLGKADNKTLRTPIKPVEARHKVEDLRNTKATEAAKAEDFPAVVHYRRETLSAPKNETWTRSEEMLVEILDSRGTALYQELAYPFLPGYDRIFMNALEVYDKNLKLKYTVPLTGTYITYATEAGTSNESQMAHFPLQTLEVGDFIYVQMSRTGIGDKGIVPYMEFKSSLEVPVAETSFRVYADTNRFVTEEYGPLERSDLADGREWRIENPIVIRNEIYMPDYRDFGAGLLLAGKREWANVGEDYENLIKHQFKNAIAVREKAIEVKGTKAGLNAILAEVRFVRENIRYRDVRFGGHSLIPQTAEQTLKSHRGDCKDMALLLKEMLATIGVESHLAAIPLTGTGYANLPTIQQFDHLILYVPATANTPELWVDPTDKTGNDRPVPLDMEGKTAFVIDGKNSIVKTTPILEDNQEHKAVFKHKLFIGENGKSEFRDSLVLEGKFASTMRNAFYGRDQREQEKLLERLLREGIPDVQLSTMRIENLNDFGKPLIIVASFGSKNYFGLSADGIKGMYPNIWERSMLRLPKVNKRHLPIRIPHETQFESTLEIATAKGKTAEIMATRSLDGEPDYINFEHIPGGIKWTTFALYADPSEYERIREEWGYLLSETSPQIIVK